MRKLLLTTALAAVTAFSVGCASRKVIADKQGMDEAKYQQDLAQCNTYADEVGVGEEAAKGAGAGAILGGAVIAILGGDAGAIARTAGVGAVVGGAKGGNKGKQEESTVVKNCMRQRGYKILN